MRRRGRGIRRLADFPPSESPYARPLPPLPAITVADDSSGLIQPAVEAFESAYSVDVTVVIREYVLHHATLDAQLDAGEGAPNVVAIEGLEI